MRSLRWSSIFNSLSTIGALVGGPLFAAGIMGVASSLFSSGAATTAAAGAGAVAGAGVTTGVATAAGAGLLAAVGGWPVVAMLAVGALFVGISVASTYVSSRIWHSKQFDNFELNAESTAHHMVQELKANNLCLTSEHENCNRKDGKSWVEYAAGRTVDKQIQL